MIKYLISLILILFPISAFSAGSISGVVSDGESVTITDGTSPFGTGPTVYKWDDFDSGSNGDYIGNGWSLPSDSDPVYTNTNQRTNSTLSAYASTGTQDLEYDHGGTLSEVFVSAWLRRDINSCTNCKFLRVWHNLTSANPAVTIMDNYSPGNVVLNWRSDEGGYINYEVYGLSASIALNGATDSVWERIDLYVKESSLTDNVYDGTEDGIIQIWQQTGGVGNTFDQTADYDGYMTSVSGDTVRYNGVVFTEYSGSSTPSLVDDVYIASSRARVEIGDNATWASCTHREIQIPTSWAAGSITITVNAGSFESGTAYLFVVDSDGDPIDINESTGEGLEFTFGNYSGHKSTAEYVNGGMTVGR